MTDNKLVLAAAMTVFSGNVAVEIPAGTEITFPTCNTRDELAEALAQNQRAYGENRHVLTHEEERDHAFAEGEAPRPARVEVSYGLHGARIEKVLGPADPPVAGAGEGDGPVEAQGHVEHPSVESPADPPEGGGGDAVN